MAIPADALSVVRIRLGYLLLAAVTLSSACKPESVVPSASQPTPERTDSPTTPAPTASWRLTVEQSGGIAGLHLRFTLDNTGGSLIAEDLRRSQRAVRPLTVEERKELSALVASRLDAPPVAAASSSCVDCFGFTLTLEGSGKPRVAHYDSMTLPGSPDNALITRIAELGRKALAPR